jgi:hypothetical protein
MAVVFYLLPSHEQHLAFMEQAAATVVDSILWNRDNQKGG